MTRPPARIEIQGLDKLVRELRLLDSALPRRVGEANKEAVDKVLVPVIKRKIAVGATGKLKKSVRGLKTQKRAVIAVGSPTRVPYAGAINFGWPARNIAAQEVIYASIVSEEDEIREVYADMLDTITRRAFPLGTL